MARCEINNLNIYIMKKDWIEKIIDREENNKQCDIHVVVKSLPQENYCDVCKLPTDGEKCYSKRCPV